MAPDEPLMVLLSNDFVLLVKILKINAQENQEPIVPYLPPLSILDMGTDIAENKTSMEQVMEECMAEYVQCVGIARNLPVCGENDKNERTDFINLCDMEYENCKDPKANWHYLNDGQC